MSEVTFDSSVIQLARQRFQSTVAGASSYLEGVTAFRDLVSLVEAVQQIEYGYEEARLNLLGLHRRGLATPSDYRDFDTLRKSVTASQQRVVDLLRIVFAGSPETLARIPPVVKPPPLGAPPSISTSSNGTRGLGNPLAAIPAWMIGAIILTWIAAVIVTVIIVGLVIIATVVAGAVAAEAISNVWRTKAQLEAHNLARADRLRVFEECRASGGTLEQCRATAESLVRDPPIIAAPSEPGSWVPWLVGGLAIVALTGGVIYVVARRSGSSVDLARLSGLSGSSHYREMSRDEFRDAPDRYDLLVRAR